jgi:hypothetical protein
MFLMAIWLHSVSFLLFQDEDGKKQDVEMTDEVTASSGTKD